ncbi:MAG: ribosome maturation factor RimP [Gemmatimonadota bacterium]
MAKGIPEVERQLEARVEELGLEVVEVEWAGSSNRRIIRVRIDRPDSRPGQGVSVDDCARVSRALEPWLDEHPAFGEKYVLEVSSPGVERPLVRYRDWVRFIGSRVQVKGTDVLVPGNRRVEGRLESVSGSPEAFRVRLQLDDGGGLELEGHGIASAHLVFDWDME